ncbi:SWI/SNF-related matrix-associated actin-dependent regulator of chromatin subfamily A-like protein 1 [Nematocida major]|uniref:SWI/SNF-related matrix-associated actin-dependent regulator of chromatin subfamily A-like protein 1 n=1 Tax=Nematocida major TaxID=1912982 RepID=UPI0020075C49|nr:SWI/SNF-related matrix-associated actin-dependent regulator of chromatin subfamily A-like protein 1 [Nematocida major]KAH9386732.1 SWI/SNF-related matrix-associated actin-dependent regulator of chromatin subfamily A-like protein 1 [Nematocida major]
MNSENQAMSLLQNTKPQTGAKPPIPNSFTITLINEQQAKISPSTKEISSHLFDKIGSKYILAENAWIFHVWSYPELEKCCSFIQKKAEGTPLCLLRALAAKYSRAAAKPKAESTLSVLEHIDGGGSIHLKPHQIEGVAVACKRNYRLLIADEMGLGKTLQAIAIAKKYLEANPNTTKRCMLIVAPASNTAMWAKEVGKYITKRCYDIKEWRNVGDVGAHEVVALIASYNGASSHLAQLHAEDFFMGIADESQSLKNHESKRAQVLVPFLTRLENVILLSGTPALSNAHELYTQIAIICPSLFSYKEYHERYCRISETHYQAVNPRFKHLVKYRGNKNLDELKIAVNALVLIRRVKQDCLQLGIKRRVLVTFNTDLVKKDVQIKIQTNPKMVTNELLTEYNTAAREKISDVLNYVQQMRSKTCKKIIVFAHHRDVLDALYEEFKSRAIKIDGSTPRPKRELLCDEFRENPKCDLAILSLKACSTGLTLVCATTVIFAELPWTPGDLHQAEDRIYRIGQTETVNIYYLIASYVDKQLWPLLKRKNRTLNGIGIIEHDKENLEFETFNPKQKVMHQFK